MIKKILKRILLTLITLFILLIITWRVDRTFFHPYLPDRETQIHDAVTTTKFTIPQDEVSCASASGTWKKIGIRRNEECNLPTTDSGKVCENSKVCESVCLADLTEDQRRQGMKGRLFKTTGKCAAWVKVVGCKAYVEDGWAGVVCVD